MKKPTLFSGLPLFVMAKQKEKFRTIFWLITLLNLLNRKRSFYCAACIALMFVLVQSACKKKETQIVQVVTISGLNKTTANIGDTLIVSGGGFNTTVSKNLVSVASIAYKVIQATSTQLTVIVPPGAQSGLLSIGFDQGQSTTFSQPITITGGTQPYIKSISPATGITEGDTVLIKGGNFVVPYNYNAVTFNGVSGQILNVSDSLMKVIVPPFVQTGPVIITTKGVNSLPYLLTVAQPNLLADGRLYWAVSTRTQVFQTTPDAINLIRGNDQNTAPYATVLSPLGTTELSQVNYSTVLPEDIFDNSLQKFNVSNIVTDVNGNGYYIYNSGSSDNSLTYSLVKLTLKPSFSRTVIWTHNFSDTEVGSTIFTDPIYGSTSSVMNYPMLRLSIDGNNLYIKLGLSKNFYAGDVSQGTFSPALKTYNIPDDFPYALEFGKNFVFYGEIEGTDPILGNGDPNYVSEIRYVPRGGGSASRVVPLDPSQVIVTYMTDPSHDDNLLIYTVTPYNGGFFYGTLYKFNAATGVLTKLFDQSNWADSYSQRVPDAANVFDLNLGFTWVNNHIYYINAGKQLKGSKVISLYRLNDDGSSSKATNIYPSIDLTSPHNYTLGSLMPLFIDKTQAKP